MNCVNKLINGEPLNKKEFMELIENRADFRTVLQKAAKKRTEEVFGDAVYIRGLIEIANICRNDCLYCGIRKSNSAVCRYRLTEEQILNSCKDGYEAGFRTFVLQGGETDFDYVPLVRAIKSAYPNCAVTLSIGEQPRVRYEALFAAGADRYLLRHETANEAHYKRLHPKEMDFSNRMRCLRDLKEIGFQTGCGFMVGSPHQTTETLAEDLAFIQEFQPHMVGIGPFIPQSDTPFAGEKPGAIELTLFLLSALRLMQPKLLLPATTALGSLQEGGREQGILHGANVVMPNISPQIARDNYVLYNNKLSSGAEAKEGLALLSENLKKIGRRITFTRGDYGEYEK